MARRTGAETSVQIDASDPLVGPALNDGEYHLTLICFPFLNSRYLKPGSMAIETGIRFRRGIGGFKGQFSLVKDRGIVYGAHEQAVDIIFHQIIIGVGHQIFVELHGLPGVAG